MAAGSGLAFEDALAQGVGEVADAGSLAAPADVDETEFALYLIAGHARFYWAVACFYA